MNTSNKNFIFNFLLIGLTIVFTIVSYLLLKQDSIVAEKELNIRHIYSFIERFENKIYNQEKIALNFQLLKDNSSILKEFGLSFILNKAKYITTNKSIKKEELLSYLYANYKKSNQQTQILNYKGNIYLVTFKNGKENLYIGSKISNKELQFLARDFAQVKFKKEKTNKPDFQLSSSHFSKIDVSLKNDELFIYNDISFYFDKTYLFSLSTKNKQAMLNKNENTQLLFTIVVLLFIFVIFLIITRYKNQLSNYNHTLEEKVNERTKQIKQAMTELEKVNTKLYDIAHTDFLTKTMNRRNFFIHAEDIFKEAKIENTTICTLMIDIDNFKLFNDNYGHDLGDKVLILFADTIKDTIDNEMIFGRLGGEEFALIIPNSSLEEAIKIAQDLKSNIEKIKVQYNGLDLKVTASFGVSDNRKCSSIDEMLQKADKLLYSAKTSGKNLIRSRYDL